MKTKRTYEKEKISLHKKKKFQSENSNKVKKHIIFQSRRSHDGLRQKWNFGQHYYRICKAGGKFAVFGISEIIERHL